MYKKALLIFVQVLVVAYLTILVFFYFTQDGILFKPSKLDKDYKVEYDFSFEERFFEVEEGIELHAVHAKADSTIGLVFFCHGNQGSVQTDPNKYKVFLDLGYDVFYFDYRGYGKSDGYIINQEQLISDTGFLYEEMKIRSPFLAIQSVQASRLWLPVKMILRMLCFGRLT